MKVNYNCNYRKPDHSLLYIMVFLILCNTCDNSFKDKIKDADRFKMTLQYVEGRLMYKKLIEKL